MLLISFLLHSLLISVAIADGGGWLSPVYTHFYEFPLPIPPVKVPLTYVPPLHPPSTFHNVVAVHFGSQMACP